MINKKDFDYKFYITIYKDLRQNNINNFENSFEHYINKGTIENRYYSFEHSKIFYENSWLLYIKNNNDLKHIKTDINAFFHYMGNGKNEKRKIYKLHVLNINDFNWDLFDFKFYNIINNLKLINKNKTDSINHFKNIGCKINLLHSITHSNIFFNNDWDRYISDYNDLENFNFKKAFLHYIEYGKDEGRKIYKKNDIDSKIINFNWKFYLLSNDDLPSKRICDKDSALKHFKSNGHKEERLYSHYHYLLYINYDWVKYSDMYDLHKSEIESFKCYVKNGIANNHKIYFSINEKNLYKEFFIEINNLQKQQQKIQTFDECKNYYLKLEYKIPYSYEHYLIYKLFNWEKIYNMNTNYFITYQIANYKDLFTEYLNNSDKFKIKLIINENIDDIYNFKNIDNLFTNMSLIKKIIQKNIIYNDSSFLFDLYTIQTKIQEKNKLNISFHFEFITIPPGFEFNKYKYDNQKLRFTFIVSSFNNKDNIYNNLLSIIYQNYSNWRIYYTNDCSTDDTDILFHKIIDDYNIKDKVKYVLNEVNMKQSCCKFNSYKLLKNNDIVAILDGDDWLSTNKALSILAYEYNNTDKLIVYSGYHVYYNNKIDKSVNGGEYSDLVKGNNEYRKYKDWLFTHLKTGYAWLFKKIPEEYLKYNGEWLDRCTDLAEMYCVAEMARTHVKHIDKILYVYNKKNSIKYDNSYYNDHSSRERKNIEDYVKNLKPLNIFLPKIFIINLKNRTDLKKDLIKRLTNFNIKNYEFSEAKNGYTNKTITDKYEEYNLKYDNNIISHITLTVEKKHINSLGALGIIYSTIELYKKINNENKELDHVLILEDDVYFHKKFNSLYNILEKDLIGKDYIYLGFNSISAELNNLFQRHHNNSIYSDNLIEIQKNHYYEGGIYGAYSYICSRKYREYVISLGVNYYVNNNINLDSAINVFINNQEKIHIKNDLNFYIFNTHLFIPEVRKSGINLVRTGDYYKERFINLDNYLI